MNNVGQEIRFKMFKDEKTAYRLRARIGMSSTSADVNGTYDSDITNTPTAPEDFIINTKTSSGLNLVLGAGLEKRRGNTRIQGYYGGEVFFGLLGGKKTTTSTGSVLSDNYVNGHVDFATARQTEQVNASKFTLGLQGFIGVEWFFAPKVSLGAEYTWGLTMNSTGEGETTTSTWGTAIGIHVALHFIANLESIPGRMMSPDFLMEFDQTENGLRERLTYPKIEMVDGMIDIPKRPGLGIDIDEAVLREYAIPKDRIESIL